MEELLLPALKYKVINYFISYDAKIGNGNSYLMDYIQNLATKYNENQICMNYLILIVNSFSEAVESFAKIKNSMFADEDYFRRLLNQKLSPVLITVDSCELLTDLLYFFEPELIIQNNKLNEILSKLNQI